MRDSFRWLFAALFVAFGASLLWCLQQHRELIRERLGAAADRQAYVDLEDRLNAAEKARFAAEASLQGQTGLNIRRMFPVGSAVPTPEILDKFNAAVDGDPIWAPFYRKLERRRILARYNILLTALNIPREKRASLEDLLVERAITSRNIAHQLRNAGRTFNSPEVIGAVGQATDVIDAKIKKLIGDNIAEKLREWNSAIYSYGNAPDGPVAQDAVTLNEAGFKLSTDQLVKLALIRYEVYVLTSRARSNSGSDPIDPKSGLTQLEKQLFTRQAEVLSPEEIAVLRNWAIEEHQARAAVDVIRAKFHIETDRTSK